VTSTSTYTGKRRTRWYSATPLGRQAFGEHVRALELIVETSRRFGPDAGT
jgi:DNA-binding PadR family transcriptional regulator